MISVCYLSATEIVCVLDGLQHICPHECHIEIEREKETIMLDLDWK